MNETKTVNLLRKRNTQLQEELEKLKQIAENAGTKTEAKSVDDLIGELEKIKGEWIEALEEVNKEREKYMELITSLKQIKNAILHIER